LVTLTAYRTSDLMVVHPNAELIDRLHRLTTEQPQSGYDMCARASWRKHH
jgi:hypothetical protein